MEVHDPLNPVMRGVDASGERIESYKDMQNKDSNIIKLTLVVKKK